MDYKGLIGQLRNAFQEDGYELEHSICESAADAIETLLAERDAAVEDMRRKIFDCGACKWGDAGCDDHPRCDCIRLARWSLKEDLWEWRGPQKKVAEMGKQHYEWWGYIKSLIRKYPENRSDELSGVALRNHEAVKKAVDDTMKMDGGANRLKVISMVHWKRTRTLGGAALDVRCSERTAYYWQQAFFKEVARNRDLLD